jgi:ATP-dependent helicase/nuclease subunit B
VTGLHVAAVPIGTPFLPALARAWLERARDAQCDPADGMLILPTRRAARATAAAFLEAHGRPLILPRIVAVGGADEAALGLLAARELPPAIPAEQRRSILARLILQLHGQDGAPTRLADALALADELARLIDDVEQAEIDLATHLPGIVGPDLAEHWQRTLDFLALVTRHWPAILEEREAVDPARRHRLSLDAQAAFWQHTPPAQPVWLAGLAVATPAVARLARVVAHLTQGCVVLAGFDPDLSDAAWTALDNTPAHPQAGLRRLINAIGADRAEIQLWSPPDPPAAARTALLRRAFLPPSAMAEWHHRQPADLGALFRLNPADEQDEARAIALALRDALDDPSRDAALVTPDRGLALRVTAELARLGIRAEDSAGENLADTPPAVLLRLLAAAQRADYAAVPLLSLLQHPLTAAGLTLGQARSLGRALDMMLRARLPGPGFSALRFAAEQTSPDLAAFIAALQVSLRPLIDAAARQAIAPADMLDALIEAAEALARSDDQAGADRLWAGPAGAALSEWLARQFEAIQGLPDISPTELPALLDAVLGDAKLRRPRTQDANPRVAIWGLLEARLQTVDTLIIGGMVEGVFPAEPDPGPWLSRPMRRAVGLPDGARLIGETAHDLTSLMASCRTVILSAPARRGRAPAVPSRFLARIETVLRGAEQALPGHPAALWSVQLDQPAARILRPRPEPRPPAAHRPKRYSISEITTLLADPYAIYAKRVLRLEPLGALDAETDAALFGTLVHEGLRKVADQPGWASASEAAALLFDAFEKQLRAQRLRGGLEAFWRVRLRRIADWIVGLERERLVQPGAAEMVATEQPGKWSIDGFVVHGRADRIERRGAGVTLIDFKTGTPPSDRDVQSGSAPQLPLEAAMAEAGGFGAEFAQNVCELAYWKLSGGATEGTTRRLFADDREQLRAIIDQARREIPLILRRFADPATPYRDRPHPGRNPYDQPYAGISRRAEWDESE